MCVLCAFTVCVYGVVYVWSGWVVDGSGSLRSSSGCLSAPFLSDAACLEDELTLTPSTDIGYRVVMSDGQCVSVAGAGPLGTKDSSGSSWCVADLCTSGYSPEGCWVRELSRQCDNFSRLHVLPRLYCNISILVRLSPYNATASFRDF